MPSHFDASRVGKRMAKDDPLGPHDVADRLDKAALRVWKIIALVEQQGPEFTAEVLGSRYLTNALPDLRQIIDRFIESGKAARREDSGPLP